jgi:trans-aconitate 2-methyltransferase
MREWNADAYHEVSDPQLRWGIRVLDRLRLEGDELVLDVGCGTGRLMELLVDRLPRGRGIGIDQSANMIQTARAYLADRSAGRGRFARRVGFVQADAAALPFRSIADAIFSTATFHWVLDHDRLFRSLFAALSPGGRLVAQCGGGPNLQRLHDRCDDLMKQPPFAPHFADWTEPWQFADAETTARRLREAGFTDVRTDVEPSPVFQPDAAAYREFLTHVIVRPYLARLSERALRNRFVDTITTLAAADSPAFELDYWRLNIEARKPR